MSVRDFLNETKFDNEGKEHIFERHMTPQPCASMFTLEKEAVFQTIL